MKAKTRGYLLIECLVYIGLVLAVLGVAYSALYRCVDRSVVLRRNVDDITSALHAGERWRADVRSSGADIRVETTADGQLLHLLSPQGQITYRFSGNSLTRRVGERSWTTVLSNLKSSTMQADSRQNVTAWRWELELEPRAKASANPSRLRPMFTFFAVPKNK